MAPGVSRYMDIAAGLRARILGGEWEPGAKLPRMSDLAAYIGDGIHHMRQFFNVVNVGAGDRHGQRNALGVRNDVMLGPQLTTIRRVLAGFFASSQGPGMGAVHGGPRPIDSVGYLKFRQKNFVEPIPDAGALPVPEIIPARHAAATTHFLREFLPGDAGLQNKNDPGKDLPSIDRLASWVSKASPLNRRQQQFDALPKGIADQWLSHGPPPCVVGFP